MVGRVSRLPSNDLPTQARRPRYIQKSKNKLLLVLDLNYEEKNARLEKWPRRLRSARSFNVKNFHTGERFFVISAAFFLNSNTLWKKRYRIQANQRPNSSRG